MIESSINTQQASPTVGLFSSSSSPILDLSESKVELDSDMKDLVLVTGALGYIGSHTVVELLCSDLDIDILAVDNLSNSSIEVLDAITKTVAANSTSKREISNRLNFIQADVKDEDAMGNLFAHFSKQGRPITAVIHFAALKSVVESIATPIRYYRENVGGLTLLAEKMQDWRCKKIIFSSSATVYGSLSGSNRCVETFTRHNTDDYESEGVQGNIGLCNPYARTKWMCEAILHDACVSDLEFKAIALRYFNPVGAHSSGLLSESPKGTPTNLIPCITRAMESGKELQVFGTDYNTSDGSAVRDFIHVVDLAKGHVEALRKLVVKKTPTPPHGYPWFTRRSSRISRSSSSNSSISSSSSSSSERDALDTPLTPASSTSSGRESPREEKEVNALVVYNLGTGQGSSVKEVLAAMRQASGHAIPAKEVPRRAGDTETSVADPRKANKELGWYATLSMQDACRDVCKSIKLS